MFFTVSTTGGIYCPDDVKKFEEIGFSFKLAGKLFPKCCVDGREVSSLLKLPLRPTLEINTLDDLKNFGIKFGRLIVNFSEQTIEIYDDYRE